MTVSRLRLTTTSALAISAIAFSGQAWAQTAASLQNAPDSASTEQEFPYNRNEIVVTATKRDQSLNEIPLAVTVLTADDLEQRNVSGFADYLPSIPGVQFNPAGNVFGNSISIRGVTDGTSSFLTQQPVALFLDDTLLTLSQGGINLDYGVFGVEQINVIKGPNSTLYGASSLGGTIKVQTRRPSLDALRADGRATLSFTEGGGTNYSVSGSVSAPLVTDVLGFEITGYYKQDGGFIDDPSNGLEDINDRETYGGRFAVRFQPNDRLTADLTGYYQKFQGDGFDTFAPVSVGDLQSRPLGIQQLQEDEFYLANLVLKYEFDFAELVSASSYFDRETSTRLDATFSFLNFSFPAPLPSTTLAPAEVFSQEIRLVSTGDGRLNWLIGGYYSNEQYSEIFGTNDANFGPLFNGDLQYEYDTYAVFGEIGFDITDALNLTVGGRYTDYDAPIEFNTSGLFIPGGTNQFVAEGGEDDFSPRIALNYEYGNGSIYAQASRGFRLGQVNVPIVTLPGETFPTFFNSDSLWNYEVGAKTSWADGRFLLNVAAYYIDWTDIQLTRTAGTGFTFIDNVGDARIFGFEAESVAYLTEDTIFSANIGLIDGQLTTTVPGVALDGTSLPGSPDVTVSLSLQQNFRIGDNDGFIRTDYLYYGEYDDQFVFAGTPLENGDYSKLDIRAGLTFGNIDISIFGTNLLDERPILTRAFAFGEEVTSIQPRTFGATIGFKY